MDSITHIVLGACIGEAIGGKKIGKKAMLIGAAAQSIPDIDFVTAFWMDVPSSLLAHRGFTHSILFAVLVGLLAAWLMSRLRVTKALGYSTWLFLFMAELGTHLLLDTYNNYGVGLFEPFSDARVSFNALYVADPFFSIWGLIGFLALLIIKRTKPYRGAIAITTIFLSVMYLGYCTYHKIHIDQSSRRMLARQGIPDKYFLSTPAPLNNWLWFIISGNDTGYYAGYRSVFDTSDQLHLEFFPRRLDLLKKAEEGDDVKKLIRFSQGFYAAERRKDTLIFNDLRFGQVAGWLNPKAPFAFYYYIEPDIDNALVVQRGRVANWNKETLAAFIKRIRGH